MPESKVPLRTGPVTASDGIHDTVVTDDSTLMSPPPSPGSRARVGHERSVHEGGGRPLERRPAPPGAGCRPPCPEILDRLNGDPWGMAASRCSSPTTT